MEELNLTTIPYITLWAYKYDECLDFYKNKLELPVIFESENFTQFDTQSTKLYLHRLTEQTELRKDTVEIHFEVEDTDKAYELLKAKGVEFEQQPENMPWGVRMASMPDPEGYSVEVNGPLR